MVASLSWGAKKRTAARSRRRPGDFASLGARRSQRLDLCGESALVSRGLVLVDDALARGGVDGGLLGLVRLERGLLVAGGDGLLDLLDGAAQRGAQAHVGGALAGGFPGA